tara:strand:+ start:41122 stop:41475 length:354 start_codon:yes stop_codon:yes gene_type:complete
MLVAIAILAMSLGVMYQVAGGATRTVGTDEKMIYGVELARSLRALHSVVPVTGLNESGETAGGFRWEVTATPLPVPAQLPLQEGQLQKLRVVVDWADGARQREFSLDSVVAGVEERP